MAKWKEEIEQVAIRIGAVHICGPAPLRHGDLIILLNELLITQPDDQGFVTNAGRYVGREEARKIAIASKQVRATTHQTELFSEDLW